MPRVEDYYHLIGCSLNNLRQYLFNSTAYLRCQWSMLTRHVCVGIEVDNRGPVFISSTVSLPERHSWYDQVGEVYLRA